MMEKSRFHLCNFGSMLILAMNRKMAAELFDLISLQPTVPTELWSLKERIETQFYHMSRFEKARTERALEVSESA